MRNSEEQVREANRGLEVHLAELRRANAEREKAEQALREAQARLEAALTAGEIGTFVWDVVTDRMYGDRNFDVLFGIPVRADGTAPLADFVEAIHPDDREHTMALVKQTMETGCDYRAEYRILTGGRVPLGYRPRQGREGRVGEARSLSRGPAGHHRAQASGGCTEGQ